MRKAWILAVAAAMVACGGNKTSEVSGSETGDENEVCEKATVDCADVAEVDETEADDEDRPNVHKSSDGALSIETGIHPDGGTSPDYWTRWKFNGEAGERCEVYMDSSPAITGISTVKKDDGSTYYLLKCFEKASSADGYEWLEAYKIVGDTIEEVNVVDGGKYKETEAFTINYCIPDWYTTTNGYGYDWMFEYDPETRDLYVPIVYGSTLSDLEVSDRYRVWHFDGKRFVDMGEKPHKDLHPSVARYNRIVKYFETEDYIVRVDSLDTKELRYASWKKPKTFKDEPDIVIGGGYRTAYTVPDDQLQPCEDYRFKKDGYEYIVNYCEVSRTGDGYGEHHDYLVVKKDGKTLLKQENKMLD